MKDLLISLFIGKKEQDSKETRYVYGRMCGIVGIVVNVVVSILEMLIGFMIGSIAMISDAFHDLGDAGGSVLTLLSFKLSKAEADSEHPFGHGRMEYLLSLGFSLILFIVAVQLGIESVKRIIHPEAIVFSYEALAVMIGATLSKFWLSRFLTSIGLDINSSILVANGRETMSDVYATGAITLGLVLGQFFNIHVDGYLGAFVTVLIAMAGFRILREATTAILGSEPSSLRVNQIKTFIKNYHGVLGVHDLLVHDYGPGNEFASIHIEVDANMGLIESHELLDRIERDIREKLQIRLTTHMDPLVQDQATRDWFIRLEKVVKAYTPKGEIHDVRLLEEGPHSTLEFLVTVPFDKKIIEEDVVSVLTACVHAISPDIQVRIHCEKTNG